MALISRIGAPVVWLLDASTKLIFRLFGQSTAVRQRGDRGGDQDHHGRGGDRRRDRDRRAQDDRGRHAPGRPGGARGDDAPHRCRLDRCRRHGIRHPRDPDHHRPFPACRWPRGIPTTCSGVVQARELLAASLRDEPLDIRAHIRKAPIIPDTLDALDALEVLRQAEVPMALVHDEYGHFDGIVTPADILDAIAGAFRSDEGTAEPEAMQREDGSWLLAGWMPADEMAEQLGIALPERRDYETVAGLVIGELQHLPSTGEAVETLGWRFEVVDLDGRRIDKVLASRIETQEAA